MVLSLLQTNLELRKPFRLLCGCQALRPGSLSAPHAELVQNFESIKP